MRKDAKIGFAIGGVLLAVLIVYGSVVSKHKKSVSTVTIVTPPADPPSSMSASGGGTSAAQPPATPPADPVVPPVVPLVHTDPTATIIPPADPGTPPSNPAPVSTPEVKPETLTDVTPDHPVTPLPGQVKSSSHKAHTAEMEVPAATTGDRTYVIQSGQTLSSIASEIYGNPRFWVAIQRENKSINPSHLKIGDKINLPDISPVGPVEEAADVEISPAVTPPSHGVTPPAAPLDAHTYVVKSGDSLYKIARTVLGSGRRADALYALNKDIIGPDKARLKLGMVLKLPQIVPAKLAISEPVR